jgi:hypothetical protein
MPYMSRIALQLPDDFRWEAHSRWRSSATPSSPAPRRTSGAKGQYGTGGCGPGSVRIVRSDCASGLKFKVPVAILMTHE